MTFPVHVCARLICTRATQALLELAPKYFEIHDSTKAANFPSRVDNHMSRDMRSRAVYDTYSDDVWFNGAANGARDANAALMKPA